MNNDKQAMDFWGRVEIAQKEAGISTLKQLCENAGVYYSTMMNKRSLGKLPSLSSAVVLAKELQRPVEWLLCGEEDVSYLDKDAVLNKLSEDKRLYEIAKKLLSADNDKLVAIEVALRIRN